MIELLEVVIMKFIVMLVILKVLLVVGVGVGMLLIYMYYIKPTYKDRLVRDKIRIKFAERNRD